MTRPLAIIVDETDLDLSASEQALREGGFDVARCRIDLDPVIPKGLRGARAAIVGYTRLDAGFFDQLPQLGAVATCSVGVDMVDADDAAARGIRVISIGAPSTEEVAVHALTLLLAAERRLLDAHAVARSGGWTEEFTARPRRFSQLTLGLYGFGKIAQRLAALAAPVVARVIAYDPYAAAVPGVELVSESELFVSTDLLSVHAPLTDVTRGAIGPAAFTAMRPGTVIVNTGRGPVIDSAALVEALDDGTIAAAGLDVFDADPPASDDPLLNHPRVIATPHIGFLSVASLADYERLPGANLVAWWQQESNKKENVS
ncbi:NAD(P)-dependent oxidoreductase [Microbacterium sp.]|uniref:NAD(P)-dependent oxidoreductase n=1 Tax=Microbacterium sp. TaxID=51671 RepID=UPI003C73CC25